MNAHNSHLSSLLWQRIAEDDLKSNILDVLTEAQLDSRVARTIPKSRPEKRIPKTYVFAHLGIEEQLVSTWGKPQ